MAFLSSGRYEVVERRKPATGFFGIIENFAMPDADYMDRAADPNFKQMRLLQNEQRRFLRGALSVSDPIRWVSRQKK